MARDTVLVTGGAGYIGSHVVMLLGEAGENVVVLDNLSTGFSDAVKYGDLVTGDTGDKKLVTEILDKYEVGAVMHFAAHTIVPESVAHPLKYYANNTCSTRNLLECCHEAGIAHFVFSSTAAVYGTPPGGRCSEETPTQPINPYGGSKLMSEQMLRDLSAATPLRHVIFRYFNVAGADPGGRIGQSTEKATLLVKVACEAAVGKRRQVAIYGTDFDTPDGTGIRDYVHVQDLAVAHIQALQYLRDDGPSNTFNCGYGHGYSVREVLEMVAKVNQEPLAISEEDRRAGDPPILIAEAERVRETLGWTPAYDDLERIVETSLAWERHLLQSA